MEIAMSVALLRQPAAVPALFARAVEPEPAPRRAPLRRQGATPLEPATAWALVVLIQVPLVKAGLAVLGLALQP